MKDINEYRTLLKSIVKSHPNGRTTVDELNKDLLKFENITIDTIARSAGSSNFLKLIETFDEFGVGYNLYTRIPYIYAKEEDHIVKMNRNLKKKSGTTRKFKPTNYNFNNNFNDNMVVIKKPDPFGFDSDDSSMDSVFDSYFVNENFDHNQPKEVEIAVAENHQPETPLETLHSTQLTSTPIKLSSLLNKTKVNENTKCSNEPEQKTAESSQIMMTNLSESQQVRKGRRLRLDLNFANEDGRKMQFQVSPNELNASTDHLTKSKDSLSPYKIVKSTDKVISPAKSIDLATHSLISVIFLEAINPHRVWFAEYFEYKQLSKLMESMQEFYNNNRNKLCVEMNDIKRGLHVVVCYTSMWHRAVIVKKLDSNSVRVFYVDFGTVEDTNIENICYIIEEHLKQSVVARRGVLAYIQPKIDGVWCKTSAIFLKYHLMEMKINAKIFKHNDDDNSYYMAMKIKTLENEAALVTNVLIAEGYADVDREFMNKNVSSDALTFQEYENGKLLDLEIQAKLNESDSWIPSSNPQPAKLLRGGEITSSKDTSRTVDKQSTTQTKKSSNLTFRSPEPLNVSKFESYDQFEQFIRSNNNSENIIDSRQNCDNNHLQNSYNHRESLNKIQNIDDISSSDNENTQNGKKSSDDDSDEREKRSTSVLVNYEELNSSNVSSAINYEFATQKQVSIKSQVLKNHIGSKIRIFVTHINDVSNFYFFLSEELRKIQDCLFKFNSNYNQEKVNLKSNEIQVGLDVAAFVDNNYCRARITSVENNTIMIFLHDFGSEIERKLKDIYKMKTEFINYPAYAFKGSFLENQNVDKTEMTKLLKEAIVADRNLTVIVRKVDDKHNINYFALEKRVKI